MTYTYAASDITIKKIVQEIEQKDSATYKVSNRPDLSIFFNRGNGNKDLIMVELKGPNADKNEKNKSITELPNNLSIIRNNIEDVNSIWGYIITTIDEDLEGTLKTQDFEKLFCNNDDAHIFHKYYKNANAHIYALDLNAVVSDAFARNKTFLDILKKS